MDRFSYEQLRQRRQDLHLPRWLSLTNTDRHYAKALTLDKLVARRVSKLFRRSGEPFPIDRIRGRRNEPFRTKQHLNRWISRHLNSTLYHATKKP